VQLRIEPKAHVGAGLRAALAAVDGVSGGVVAAAAGFVLSAARRSERGAVVEVVVRGLRPDGVARRVDAAERELVKHLRAHAEVAVQLEHGAGVPPPVFGEDLTRATLAGAVRRALVVLTAQLGGVVTRLGERGHRREATARDAGGRRCRRLELFTGGGSRGGIGRTRLFLLLDRRGRGLRGGSRGRLRRGGGRSGSAGGGRLRLRLGERRSNQKTERD
jgi:hypothetical protein